MNRWEVVIVDLRGISPADPSVTGPRWWCRFVAGVNNAILRPIPDFPYRYEVRRVGR